jgi:hypothetical protein
MLSSQKATKGKEGVQKTQAAVGGPSYHRHSSNFHDFPLRFPAFFGSLDARCITERPREWNL